MAASVPVSVAASVDDEPVGRLLDLEAGRFFERILNPAEGLYPKFGTITAGSGFAVGPGYRATQRLGGVADFSTFAMGSIKKYWIADARMQLPRLLDEHLAIDAHIQTYDFQEELFFGLGPDSARSDLVHYGMRNTLSQSALGQGSFPGLQCITVSHLRQSFPETTYRP